MATITRSIYTAAGAGLRYPNGNPVATKKVIFTLVDAAYRPISVYDVATGELIAGSWTAVTDLSGEFTIHLWPTTRGNKLCLYVCHIEESSFSVMAAPLPESNLAPIRLMDWYASGTPLTAAELSGLTAHLNDMSVHLTLSQNAALDAATTLSALNPVATLADLNIASGSLIYSYVAGENLSGHRAVYMGSNGKIYYADNSSVAQMNSVLGMTTGAAVVDTPVSVQAYGTLIEPTWAWTPGLQLWIGTAGAITQTIPVTGYALEIGTAVNATSAFINPKIPIKLI